jgi:tetratricopeptide (TPR) repeat protein
MRRMSMSFLVTCLWTSAALAQAPAGAEGVAAPKAEPPAAPAAEPPPAAPTAPTAPTDPLQEPKDLIESAPNTRENLKKAIGLYDERLKDPALSVRARADGWADVSRAYLRLGDLETASAVKIDLYTKGRAAAKKALALEPNHTEALFWDLANLATTGRTKGVMNSLFMLGELRTGLNRVLELDPNHHYARQTLGEIDHAVPGIAGGSDERAEKAYLEVLRRDPRFTPTMVNLAKLYKDKGKKAEARTWAQKALDTRSSVPNDWKKFDRKDAQQLLKELE